jgi:hypothetical protein
LSIAMLVCQRVIIYSHGVRMEQEWEMSQSNRVVNYQLTINHRDVMK